MQIRINAYKATDKDQSSDRKISMNVAGGVKTFEFDGSAYTLQGTEIKSVPDKVAIAWVANDSSVEIVPEGIN